jgi:hypothetical protein
MRMWLLLTSICFICSPCFGEELGRGDIKLHIVDCYGHALREARIKMLKPDDLSDTGLAFKGLAAYNIPFGQYVLKVNIPGFNYGIKHIVVDQPLTWFQVGLEVGTYDFAKSVRRLTGTVASVSYADTYVKLMGVFCDVSLLRPINSAGAFVFDQVPDGSYLIVIFKNADILASEELIVKSSRSINIDVKSPRPTFSK